MVTYNPKRKENMIKNNKTLEKFLGYIDCFQFESLDHLVTSLPKAPKKDENNKNS